MSDGWISRRFPELARQIRELTEQHRELKHEPLHLAVCYGPRRDQQDVFLWEVISGWSDESVSPDRELFETTFSPAPSFPMSPAQHLHLVLTTPYEFEVAMRERWWSALEIVDAIRAGDYEEVYADEVGRGILSSILTSVGRVEETTRG